MRWLLFAGIVALVSCRQKASSDAPPVQEATRSASAPASSSAPVASGPPVPSTCPKGRELDIDLVRWKAKLEGARTPKARDTVLGELGFDAVEVPAKRAVLRIDEAALGNDAPSDRVVTVRYARQDDHEIGGAVRIAILKRLPNGHFCSIPSDFDVNQAHQGSACLGPNPDEIPPVDVTLVHLTSAKRHTLQVARQNGKCSQCGRGGHYEVAFLDLVGFSLATLFEHTLYDTSYSGCPFPPVLETFGSVELEGPFPRKIISVAETVCHTPDADLPAQYRVGCKPSNTTVKHGFLGGKYVAIKAASPTPPHYGRLAMEDLTFHDTTNGGGWGNRCYLRLKAHRVSEARAACQRGLASNPSQATEGAIHFNLAMIAEEEGNRELACAELTKSQKARPNDAATKNRMTKLGCP